MQLNLASNTFPPSKYSLQKLIVYEKYINEKNVQMKEENKHFFIYYLLYLCCYGPFGFSSHWLSYLASSIVVK